MDNNFQIINLINEINNVIRVQMKKIIIIDIKKLSSDDKKTTIY